MSETDLAQISVEQDGRVLTGIGADADSLTETMARHAPKDASESIVTGVDVPEPRQSRGQKRFSDLTSERDKATNRAEQAERERDELRQRLAATPTTERTPARVEQPPPVAATGGGTRTKPSEDEVGQKYQTYGDYVEDLADWKAEQRLSALDFDATIRRSIEADRASRAFHEQVAATAVAARKVYADFDAVLASGPGATITLGADEHSASRRVQAIAQMPGSEHVQYAIARDGELASRLARCSDVEFGMELARLAASAAVVSPASTARTMVPPPPAPMQPVAGGGSTTVPSSAVLAARGDDDYDRSGYREKRAKERGVRA